MQRLPICFLTLGLVAFTCCGCRDSVDAQPEPTSDVQPEPTSDKQPNQEGSKHDLTIQLQDDSDHGDKSAADFEKRWTKLYDGQSKTENGHWVMEVRRPPPPGPGEVVMGGFATTQRHFNPRLAGTNGVEITVVGFSHEDYDPEMDKPGQLVQAWSMTLGSWRGSVGGQTDKQGDRAVQLHFDLRIKFFVSFVF